MINRTYFGKDVRELREVIDMYYHEGHMIITFDGEYPPKFRVENEKIVIKDMRCEVHE